MISPPWTETSKFKFRDNRRVILVDSIIYKGFKFPAEAGVSSIATQIGSPRLLTTLRVGQASSTWRGIETTTGGELWRA